MSRCPPAIKSIQRFFDQPANLYLIISTPGPVPTKTGVKNKLADGRVVRCVYGIKPVEVTEEEVEEMAINLVNLTEDIIELIRGGEHDADIAKFDEMRSEYYRTHAYVMKKVNYAWKPHQLTGFSLQDFRILFELDPQEELELEYVLCVMRKLLTIRWLTTSSSGPEEKQS